METEFGKYSLEDLLDDPGFCSWARSERPDLDDDYRRLLEKYPEQKDVFQQAYQIVRLFDDEKAETTLSRKLQLWEEVKNDSRRQNISLRSGRLVFRYAAAVILLSLIVFGIYEDVGTTEKKEFMVSYDQQDFTETRLFMGDGKEIPIPADESEIVYGKNGRQIAINGEPVTKDRPAKQDETNELVVSFGKTSKIVLSDCTEVWLNAGSRLVYPVVFEDGKRHVLLQGEALFKVSKDEAKPFMVETGCSKINVLGTTFNVRAYPDENYEETVLAEGSVRLSLGKTFFKKDVLLKPDQRALVFGSDNSYTLSNVNADDYTSWINGLFVFTDEPLPSVLTRISRFYNIQIKWPGHAKSRKIAGKLDLKDNYQRVLHALATISDGSFQEESGIIYFKFNNQ